MSDKPTGKGIAILLAALLASASAAAENAASVPTRSGVVEGHVVRDGTALAWLGVPYAEPPVGERRWQAPQPHAPWSTPYRAERYGAPCLQMGGPYGPPPAGKPWGLDNLATFGKPVGSEDCLTLNLWRPAAPAARSRPVLVFVHGGANVAGYSSDPTYDGAALATGADALVVTLNYRLGIFGWFTHPSLQNGDPLTGSGDFGTLDIVAALRFVQDNAAAFGGDPGNVTLMGQSAGAISVYGLMASPAAAGLFHKAIVLSGLAGDSTAPEEGYAYAEKFAAHMLIREGAADGEAAAKAQLAAQDRLWLGRYLKARPAERILELLWQDPALKNAPGGFGDGAVLPAKMAEAFDQGRFRHMPTLVGATGDEAKLFAALIRSDPAERFRLMRESDPDGPPIVAPRALITPWLLPWIGSAPFNGINDLLTCLLLRAVDKSARSLARHSPDVYVYRFDWNRAPEPWKTIYGASHGLDLPFLFGNFSSGFFAMDFSKQNQPGREALSHLMMQAVKTFLRTGDPNGPGLPHWPAWNGEERGRLVWDASDLDVTVAVR